jgi:hypothetical protein
MGMPAADQHQVLGQRDIGSMHRMTFYQAGVTVLARGISGSKPQDTTAARCNGM